MNVTGMGSVERTGVLGVGPPIELLAERMDPGAEPGQRIIVIIDPRSLIRECLATSLRAEGHYTVLSFSSIATWRRAGIDSGKVVVLMVATLPSGAGLADPDLALLLKDGSGAPVVLLSDDDEFDHIMSAIENGARGYIPTTMSLEIVVGAVDLVRAGGTFVPAQSLMESRRSGGGGRRPAEQPYDGLFTARQVAVVDALRTGKANKIIAYELNMRESTVKVHVRNVMKKLKARNRTEVAFLISKHSPRCDE